MERSKRQRRPAHRTTVEIDLDAYEGARGALGTTGFRDTVNEALRDVDRRAKLQRAAAAIRAGGLNLVRPEDLQELRASRS
jgi:Arc/MetJ family transcription regulator